MIKPTSRPPSHPSTLSLPRRSTPTDHTPHRLRFPEDLRVPLTSKENPERKGRAVGVVGACTCPLSSLWERGGRRGPGHQKRHSQLHCVLIDP